MRKSDSEGCNTSFRSVCHWHSQRWVKSSVTSSHNCHGSLNIGQWRVRSFKLILPAPAQFSENHTAKDALHQSDQSDLPPTDNFLKVRRQRVNSSVRSSCRWVSYLKIRQRMRKSDSEGCNTSFRSSCHWHRFHL